MFKENLSAKMKEIRFSMTKKFKAERRASEMEREQSREEEKAKTEQEVDRMVHRAGNAAINQNLLDRQAP